MKIIARIQSDFKDKFGIPRQSGLVNELTAKIVFEPEYRNIDAFKGLSGFNYIWLIWEFSETITDTFKASVRPPRLPRNEHLGVFATRSPYRPNPIGLSSVRLISVEGWYSYMVLTNLSKSSSLGVNSANESSSFSEAIIFFFMLSLEDI